MPGVRIVEEPEDDLWFPPDQCVMPELAGEELRRAGFLGLGDYYDPDPWMPAHPGLGNGEEEEDRDPDYPFSQATSIREVRVGPEYRLDPEIQRIVDEQWAREHDWRKTLPPLLRHAPREVIEDIQNKVLYLSVNYKTGYSFNIRIQKYLGALATPRIKGKIAKSDPSREIAPDLRSELREHPEIGGTCRPTTWCMKHCYAKVGRFVGWDEQHWYNLSKQQARYLQNLIVSNAYEHASQAEVNEQADEIYNQVRGKFFTMRGKRSKRFPTDAPLNLRWNGGGDFNKGTCRIVNALTERHSDFLVWGFSRKMDTADLLVRRPNLRLQFSLDPSTPIEKVSGAANTVEELCAAAYKMGGHMSFATGEPRDKDLERFRQVINAEYGNSLRVNTIFGYHCGSKHTEIQDVVECSATNPRVYATCQKCRWCMMTDEERAATPRPDGGLGVWTPNQAFFAHGYEPDYKKIAKENEKRAEAGHPEVEPVTEEEAFSV
jgi:hypothetical protein